MVSSIPSGLYFSPSFAISKDLKRPSTYNQPSGCRYPKSPVCNQPSTIVSAVLFSFLQYPAITFPPFIHNSPFCPWGNSCPSSSQTFKSIGFTNIPEEPKR